MDPAVTPAADQAIDDIAKRHGLSKEAVLAMLLALRAGGGRMAQFSIPELGGSGQWMRGGMTMVGDMFDNSLKVRVDALCTELAQLVDSTQVFAATPAQNQAAGFGTASTNWWPEGLGVPSSTGAQNGVRYAIFPGTRRLVVESGGAARVYDTGDHRIGGVQQQQGGPAGTLSFTSQLGTFDVSSLRALDDDAVAQTPAAAPAPDHQAKHRAETPPVADVATPSTSGTADGSDAVIAAIESLAGLHQRGILTDEEFTAKKAELLSRL
ncbi:SHOCT domain-containing protein [Gordonia sp. CPCC 205515]|uniref:SHOCT domain-containing protein n=1 Tax=Gordonia sp. CPCC 205515 TaxID=3140791 RepID=UPI003AF3A2ED